MDLIVKNAKLRGKKKLADIGISEGKIVEIGDKIKEKSDNTIDARGKLTTPTFVETHCHLDKCLIGRYHMDRWPGFPLPDAVQERHSEAVPYLEAQAHLREAKKTYSTEDIMKRAGTVIQWFVSNGVTKFRTNVDIDSTVGLVGIKGILEVRKAFSDIADIQIVAYPQQGIIKDGWADGELLRKAMELGADVAGGSPFNELCEPDFRKHMDIVFEIAKEFDADIDMHIDGGHDATQRNLFYYTAKAIKENYQGRTTAGHVVALTSYNERSASKAISQVKRAEMNIVTNPTTTMFFTGGDNPRPRGITRVRELMAAGVNVAYGQDNINDIFDVYGTADPLVNGLITAHAAQLIMPMEIEMLFDMPTFNSAKVLRIEDYGIEVGKTANLNVIDAPTVKDAIRLAPARLYVIRNGKIIAETIPSTKKIYRGK